MEKNPCPQAGEVLSLVEESVQDYAPKQDDRAGERPTENLTRLIDTRELLKELWESRKKAEELAEELYVEKLSRQMQGGRRKMGGTLFGKALTACAMTAAAIFGFYSVSANSQLRSLREISYTASELSHIVPLRKELGEQIKAADECLGLVMKVERNYELLARDSLEYIESSVPSGELEDAVAEEVAGLRQFLKSSGNDSTRGRVEFCQSRYRDAERDDLSKPSLQTMVWYANEGYSQTMGHYNERSKGIVTMLSRFRKYVEHHPLKQRMQMLARIDIEIGSRNTIIEQTAKYKGVFDANNASGNIIPVKPLKGREK